MVEFADEHDKEVFKNYELDVEATEYVIKRVLKTYVHWDGPEVLAAAIKAYLDYKGYTEK